MNGHSQMYACQHGSKYQCFLWQRAGVHCSKAKPRTSEAWRSGDPLAPPRAPPRLAPLAGSVRWTHMHAMMIKDLEKTPPQERQLWGMSRATAASCTTSGAGVVRGLAAGAWPGRKGQPAGRQPAIITRCPVRGSKSAAIVAKAQWLSCWQQIDTLRGRSRRPPGPDTALCRNQSLYSSSKAARASYSSSAVQRLAWAGARAKVLRPQLEACRRRALRSSQSSTVMWRIGIKLSEPRFAALCATDRLPEMTSPALLTSTLPSLPTNAGQLLTTVMVLLVAVTSRSCAASGCSACRGATASQPLSERLGADTRRGLEAKVQYQSVGWGL